MNRRKDKIKTRMQRKREIEKETETETKAKIGTESGGIHWQRSEWVKHMISFSFSKMLLNSCPAICAL